MFALELRDSNNNSSNKFSNEKSAIEMHVEILFNLPHISKVCSSELHQLLSVVIKSISALEAWGYMRDKLSDLFLVKLIMKQLDPETSQLINNLRSVYGPPSCDELIKFLVKRTRALEILEMNKKLLEENSRKEQEVNSSEYDVCPVETNSKSSQCADTNNKGTSSSKEYAKPREIREIHSKFKKPDKNLNITEIPDNSDNNNSSNNTTGFTDYSKKFHSSDSGSDSVNSTNSNSKETEITDKRKGNRLSTAIVLVNDSKGRFKHCRTLLDSQNSLFVTMPEFL